MVAPIDIISSAISLEGLTVNNNRNSVTLSDSTNANNDESNSLKLSYSPSASMWTLDYSLDLDDPTTLTINEENSTTWRDDIAQHIVNWRNEIQNYTTAADNIVLAFTAHKFARDKDIEPRQLNINTAKEIVPRGWDYIPDGEIINDDTAHAMLSLQQPASPFVWTMTFVPNTYYMPCNIYDKQNNNNFNGVYHVSDIMRVFNASFSQERAQRRQRAQRAQEQRRNANAAQRTAEPAQRTTPAAEKKEPAAQPAQRDAQPAGRSTETAVTTTTQAPATPKPTTESTNAQQSSTSTTSTQNTHSAMNSAIRAQSLSYEHSRSNHYQAESLTESHYASATKKLNSDINTAINSSLTNF